MARPTAHALLLILGCLALSSTFAQASSEDSAGLDANFLSSWLGLGSDEAAQLASTGASAAATRRAMLATAAAGNGFGTQALPGAYPTPPPPKPTPSPPPPVVPTGPQVQFTARLGRTSVATFNVARQATYRRLVATEVRLAGGQNPTISTLSIVRDGTAVLVVTRVVLPGVAQTAAVQRLVARLEVFPGPSSPWLNTDFRGSEVSRVISAVACTDNLCQTCPVANKAACSKCVAFTDPLSGLVSVYQDTRGQCKKCKLANCATCTRTGACSVCKTGFALKSGTCVRVCQDSVRCTKCSSQSNICDICVARSGGQSIYLTNNGQCKACLVPDCTTCTKTGFCLKCRAGFVGNNRGGCKRCTTNCAVCLGANTCRTCNSGFRLTPVRTCRRV